MTSEITEAMVEAAGNELIGYGTDHGWFRCPATMTEFFEHDPIGHSEFQTIVAQVIEAALVARPAPEAGSDDLITDLRKAAFTEPEPGRHSLHLAAIEKIERLERERDDARKNALENGMELCRQRSRAERLWKAIDDALGRHQITHIHAGLRAALQQEGK